MSADDQRPHMVAELELESSLDSVDAAENHAITAGQQAGLTEEEIFRFGYAVREAMVNAVVHGNRYNSNKLVLFRMFTGPGYIEVAIRDFGDGFNASGVADPLAEENLLSQSGRGLALIRAFVDELSLAPADGGGTAAILRKYVKAGTETPPEVSD